MNAIDEAGNAFVKDGNTLVLISGRPRVRVLRRPSLWSKRSLQVILALLVRPALLHESRRTIAVFAGVSTGTAHTTVQTQLQRKDLIEREDGMAFTNFDRLLDEWVTLYPSLLREALQLGRYRATEPNWWTDMLAPNDEWMLGLLGRKGPDLAHAHAARVHRDDALVEAGEATLVFGNQDRFEAAVAVAGHFDAYRPPDR